MLEITWIPCFFRVEGNAWSLHDGIDIKCEINHGQDKNGRLRRDLLPFFGLGIDTYENCATLNV